MHEYGYSYLDDYLAGDNPWPRTIMGAAFTDAAMAAKRRDRRKAPCAMIMWDQSTYWEKRHPSGQLVHVERYQAQEPRKTLVWWRPNETYPHPWDPAYAMVVSAYRQGRDDLDQIAEVEP